MSNRLKADLMKSKYLTLISANFTENFVFFATMIRKKGKGKDIAIFQIRSWTNSIFVSIQNKKKFIGGRKSTSAIWRIFFACFFRVRALVNLCSQLNFQAQHLTSCDRKWQCVIYIMVKSVWSFKHWDAKLVRLLPKNKSVPLK